MSRSVPGGALRVNPQRHLIRDTELSRFLQRHLNEPRMLTYFHVETKRWVVACWVRKEWGLMKELFTLKNLGDFSADDRIACERWKHWQTPSGRQQIKEAEAAERRDLVQWDEEMREDRAIKKSIGRLAGGVVADHPFWDMPNFAVAPMG